MTTILKLKQHDLEPPLVATVTDGVATFDAALSWRVLLKIGSTVYIDDAPTVEVSEDGRSATVTHEWVAPETDIASSSGRAEVEVTWPDGGIQTFPPTDYLRFAIAADLG